MSVRLPANLQRLVERQMRRGRYASESEVLRDALNLLEVRNQEFDAQVKSIRRGVQAGLADAKAGRVIPLEQISLESVRRLAKARSSRRKKVA